MTGLIPNHGLNRTCGRGSTTLRPGVSPNGVSGDSPLDPGSNNYQAKFNTRANRRSRSLNSLQIQADFRVIREIGSLGEGFLVVLSWTQSVQGAVATWSVIRM